MKQKFDHEVSNASVVVIRPPTGEVLAMVGSLDYFDDSIDGQVNMAVSPRQPGSSFKPYTYLTAFESGAFSPFVDGDGRPHRLPRPRQPALRAGELRPQVPRPAVAAPGACSAPTTSRPSG